MANLQAAFIALNSICFVLNIPPLIWHVMSKNIPAMALLTYMELMMINGLVGSAVWGGSNFINSWNGEGWCDIMIRIQIASSIGLVSSVFCISLNLLMIFLANRFTIFWFGNKYVKIIFEILSTIFFPFLISGVTYFAQTRRYQIFQYSGCTVSLSNERITVLVYFFWIYFWIFLGAVVSLSTLFIFFKKRRAAKDILVCTNSGLSIKRFLRLLIFCILVICASISLCVLFGIQLKNESNIFYNESSYSKLFWYSITKYAHSPTSDYDRWLYIAVSFISFFLFGIGEDAAEIYVSIIKKLPFGQITIDGFNNWRNKKFENSKYKYMVKFNLAYNDSENDTDNYSRSINADNVFSKMKESPSDTLFDEFDDSSYNQIDDKQSSANCEQFDANSDASPTGSNFSDNIDYYNDPAVRYQLDNAERQLEMNTFDEFKYLYS